MSELVRFVEALPISQGAGAGELFRVMPWQRRFLRRLELERGDLALSMGRGGGKTTFAAAIGCAALWGPLAQPRGETVIVASAFAQARVSFEHLVEMLPADREPFRIWNSQNAARVIHRRTGASVRCIGADPRRAHGLAPSLVIADELASWPETTLEAMLAALRTGLGKHDEPGRLVAIGTRPARADHPFERMLQGPGGTVYAADPDDPIGQARTWRKANPSLRYMPGLEARTRQEAAEAKADPSLLASFRALRLNLGTADTAAPMLLEAGTWERAEIQAFERGLRSARAWRRGPCAWGVDLGGSEAMSAAAAYWPESGWLEAVACFAAEPSLAKRGLLDGVGRRYVAMSHRGELVIAGEYVADVGGLLGICLERWGRPDLIVADRYRGAELRQVLGAIGFPDAYLELRGQGFKDGGADVRAFRQAVGRGEVLPQKSLLLRSAMSEARVLVDAAGNSKLAKATQGGRRLRARDDAAAAAILAVAAGSRAAAAMRSRPTSAPQAVRWSH